MSRESLIVGRDLPSPSFVEGHAPAAVEVARRAEAAAAHLARVAASADVAQVYGALVDLFISTSPDLVETRAAALERYERALSRAEREALAAAVETGLTPTSVIPPCPCSMYTAGVTEGAPLVLRSEAAPEPEAVAQPDRVAELEPEAGPPAARALELVPDQTTSLALVEPAELELAASAALEAVPARDPQMATTAAEPGADAQPTGDVEAPPLATVPEPAAEQPASQAVAALAPTPERPRFSLGTVLAGLGAVAVVLRALRRRRHKG